LPLWMRNGFFFASKEPRTGCADASDVATVQCQLVCSSCWHVAHDRHAPDSAKVSACRCPVHVMLMGTPDPATATAKCTGCLHRSACLSTACCCRVQQQQPPLAWPGVLSRQSANQPSGSCSSSNSSSSIQHDTVSIVWSPDVRWCI
jgi:hypothetical protein